MILLLNLLQFYIHLVTFTDNLGTSSLISRFFLRELTHTTVDSTLLLVHLTENREQTSRLLLGEISLTGQKRLHVSLKLLGRELMFLCTGSDHCQESQKYKNTLFHHSFIH